MWPATRHRTGSRTGRGRDDEDQRLDDLPELRAERGGRLGGGVGRLVERRPRASRPCGRRHRGRAGSRDGRGRRARPESSIGPDDRAGSAAGARVASRPWSLSSSPTATRRLASGPRSRLARLGRRRRARHRRRRRRAPCSRPSASPIDLWVGDGDSIGEDALAALEAAGVPLERSPPGQGRIGHRAGDPRGAPPRRRRRPHPRRAGRPDRSRARQHRPARDARAGRSPGGHPRRAVADRARSARPGPDGAAVERPLPGRPGDLVSLLPLGAGVEGVTTRGLAYPLVDEPLPVGPRPRALERPLGARRGGHRPARPAARRGVACYALSHEHCQPSATSRPRSPCPTRPGPSIASPTSAAGGPSSTSTRRTTRPAAPSRRASSAIGNETIHERGADVWGVSPQGAASKRAFREKFELPFTLLADEDHAVADAYGSWVEKQNYGKTYWGVGTDDVPGRTGRPHRPGLAEGQAGGPRGGGPRRARRAPGGARFVTRRAPSSVAPAR